MINRNRLIKLTQSLIRIDSQNPPGDEREIALFVKDYFSKYGIRSKIYEFKRRRSNIVAVIKGTGSHSLLLTPHLDTVPSGGNWSFDPFCAKVGRGKIYGLGATDCKCNLASIMEVMGGIIEEKVVLPYSIIFAATADEESGSVLGLTPLLDKGILKPSAALVLDADENQIITTQKGLMHLKIKIKGKKAHGAYPDLGINAIDIAVKVISKIKTKKFSYHKNKYLKAPTVNIGTIKGGDKVNVVADWCEFELDFRFLPGTDYRELFSSLKSTLRMHARQFNIEITGIQKPYYISEKHPLVKYLKMAFINVGITPKVCGSEGATVISFFQKKGIPAVATGFGSSSCAHAINEYVIINDLYKGTAALDNFLKIYQP